MRLLYISGLQFVWIAFLKMTLFKRRARSVSGLSIWQHTQTDNSWYRNGIFVFNFFSVATDYVIEIVDICIYGWYNSLCLLNNWVCISIGCRIKTGLQSAKQLHKTLCVHTLRTNVQCHSHTTTTETCLRPVVGMMVSVEFNWPYSFREL